MGARVTTFSSRAAVQCLGPQQSVRWRRFNLMNNWRRFEERADVWMIRFSTEATLRYWGITNLKPADAARIVTGAKVRRPLLIVQRHSSYDTGGHHQASDRRCGACRLPKGRWVTFSGQLHRRVDGRVGHHQLSVGGCSRALGGSKCVKCLLAFSLQRTVVLTKLLAVRLCSCWPIT